jgi:nucleoside-diphosphate-sugar epimerase
MATFITGGYGHIASWTAYLLAKEGERVIIYDTNPIAPDYLGDVSKKITFIRGDVMLNIDGFLNILELARTKPR